MTRTADDGECERDGAGSDYEDRVAFAVSEALVGTIDAAIRGVAIRVDPATAATEVLFVSAENFEGHIESIAEFSARLTQRAPWLRHTTQHSFCHKFDGWTGRDERLVFATRDPPGNLGLSQEGEYANIMFLIVASTAIFNLSPEMWGLSFASDAATRTVDIYLAYSGELTLQDHDDVEELIDECCARDTFTFWRAHVWIGSVDNGDDWPGRRRRLIHVQRPADWVDPFAEPDDPDGG